MGVSAGVAGNEASKVSANQVLWVSKATRRSLDFIPKAVGAVLGVGAGHGAICLQCLTLLLGGGDGAQHGWWLGLGGRGGLVRGGGIEQAGLGEFVGVGVWGVPVSNLGDCVGCARRRALSCGQSACEMLLGLAAGKPCGQLCRNDWAHPRVLGWK